MVRGSIFGKMVNFMKVSLKKDSEMDLENGIFLQNHSTKGNLKAISSMDMENRLSKMEIIMRVSTLRV